MTQAAQSSRKVMEISQISDSLIDNYNALAICLEDLSQYLTSDMSREQKKMLVNSITVQIKGIFDELTSIETDDFYSEALKEVQKYFKWQSENLLALENKCREPAITFQQETSDPGADLKEKNECQKFIDSLRRETGPNGLDAIAGLKEAKQLIKEAVILPLEYPHWFTDGRKPWNSVLLYGPPGTGKTRLAYAAAAQARAQLYLVTPSDLLSSWFGKTEKNIRDLFNSLRERSKFSTCILFFDEVDGLCRTRTDTETDNTRRVKVEMLNAMQEGPSKSKLFFLCATNCPWDIDPAFLRRFQRRVFVPLPDRESRLQIIQSNCFGADRILKAEQWKVLLDNTEGFSGSDLISLTMSALNRPIEEVVTATHWTCHAGKWIPCQSSHPQAVKRDLSQMPSSSVTPRALTANDLFLALRNTKATVPPEVANRYTEFTQRFGQRGFL